MFLGQTFLYLVPAACWCDVLEDNKYAREQRYLEGVQLSLFW